MSPHEAASAANAVRDVLRNRSIRRIAVAWTTGTAADWALLVVLLIVAYDAGGAVAAGILAGVRVIPGIVAAPFATTLVERYRGDRVLTVINLVRSAGAIATAIVVATDLPVELTYVLAALVAGAGSLVRPIQAALLPAFARTPGELVAANVASSMGEGFGTFVGPLAAGLLVALTGSVAASLLVAAAFAGAAAAVTGIRFEHAADARGGVGPDTVARFRLADAPRVFRRYPGAAVLMGDFVAQIFVRGLLITFIVVASIELLDMGDTGVGLLNAALGLGGLVGAVGALRLRGGSQLGTVCALALAGWGLPLVLIGAWPTAALALAALFVTGVSNSLLDISGFTLVQRSVRNEDRMLIFGVLEGLLGIGLLLGSLLAPALIAVFGIRGAFVVGGALLPLLAVLTWRSIQRSAERSARTEEHIALLRRNPLFAPLPLTALDRLAERLVPHAFGTGEVVMRKGEPGDHYLLIAEGEVEVSDDGHVLRTCGPGDGVGEIALLHRVPRTATVTACSPVRGYAIDAGTFLAAVAGPSAAALAAAVAGARLEASERLTAPVT
jgi:Cyclic nucleotide-binding domain/Major Facilitator Superfamily